MKNLYAALLMCLTLAVSTVSNAQLENDLQENISTELSDENFECNTHTPKCTNWKQHKAKIMKLPGGGLTDIEVDFENVFESVASLKALEPETECTSPDGKEWITREVVNGSVVFKHHMKTRLTTVGAEDEEVVWEINANQVWTRCNEWNQ